MVSDPDIWNKNLCKTLEEQRFRWKNHKYSRDCCDWVFINLTTKEMCMGVLGMKTCSPYIDHAISFEDFYLVYDEYLKTGRISDATRDSMMAKYKDMFYTVANKEQNDLIIAKQREYERELKLPKVIISYDEYKDRVRKALAEYDREYIVDTDEHYIKSEYEDRIKQLKQNKITQKQFDVSLFDDFIGRLMFWC